MTPAHANQKPARRVGAVTLRGIAGSSAPALCLVRDPPREPCRDAPQLVPVIDARAGGDPGRGRVRQTQLAVPGLRHLRAAAPTATALPWALRALTGARHGPDALIYWLDKVRNVHLPAPNWK